MSLVSRIRETLEDSGYYVDKLVSPGSVHGVKLMYMGETNAKTNTRFVNRVEVEYVLAVGQDDIDEEQAVRELIAVCNTVEDCFPEQEPIQVIRPEEGWVMLRFYCRDG